MVITLNTKQYNENLLDLLRYQESYIPAYCGGKGICGKCKVRFMKNAPEPTENERTFFSEEELENGWRLACESEVNGKIELELSFYDEESMEIETGFYGSIVRQYDDENNTELVAVDIGTTTIAAAKIDKNTKKVIKTVTSVNNQRMFGADVISRIEAANNGRGEQLQGLILNDIEKLFRKLEISKEDTKVIISGNTTMEHLLQGYSCKTLGIAPYETVDISLHEYENMTILPGISTFVGADIVSGIIATGMNQSDSISILVDVGTNGEMSIGNKDRILVASTAAGPAFEGGNIAHGMAGIKGAIDTVTIDDGEASITTIGGGKPIGICGSGVLEVTYELLKNELIDETGLLEDEYFDAGFPLSTDVTFTGKDIREVQLAKSAIRTGIEILIKEYGITYKEIDKLYLAGGFGQHINIKKAVGIGLLPKELEEKVVAVGNTSLAGAVLYATNSSLGLQFEAVAKTAKEISLAENRAFNDLYMEYMFFPEPE